LLLVALGLSFTASLIEWEILSRQTGRAWFSLQSLFTGKILAVFILFAFFAFEKFKIPFATQLTKLAPKSYGIYLIHAIILEYLARLTYHLAPKLLQFQLVFLALLVVAGVGIPVLMMWTINKIPRLRFLYAYLFG
jgi:surface polysaccharide O-acyltransferase-like enzyme